MHDLEYWLASHTARSLWEGWQIWEKKSIKVKISSILSPKIQKKKTKWSKLFADDNNEESMYDSNI